jgi:uncharacterized membrane protein
MVRFSLYPICDSYLLVAAVALMLGGLLILGPAQSKTTPFRRGVLVAIRVLVIVLVILAMLRPTLIYTETRKQPATLVVLADQSRSMSVPDGIGGKSRWEVIGRALGDAASELNRLGRDFEIRPYRFDSELHPAEIAQGKIRLPETPEGKETALGACLEDVLRNEAGKRLLGVILLSDGAQRAYAPRDTAPQTAGSHFKHLGCPLYTVPVGESRHGQDVAVKELLANEQVFVKNRLEIAGQIHVDGFTNRKIPVRLIAQPSQGSAKTEEEMEVTATGDDSLVPYKFIWVPKTPGEYKLTVEAVQQPGERVVSNNQMTTYVNVLKGGLTVLYCEGELRWEQKYLLRALGSSPDIKVDYVRIDPHHPEQSRPADLRERFRPGKYDVYILGDLDSSVFTQEELTDLARTVKDGAGLIMLGGLHSFGPGGYAETPLANVLPVRMEPVERQPLDGRGGEDLHVSESLRMRPTELGLRHFAMMLGATPQESASIWAKLPPLEGANRFNVLAPAAVVLASAGKTPLLVAHTVGSGRAMAFAGDTTWRWWAHGYINVHKRFWRQIILWLARKDQAQEGNVWVRFQQRRLAPAQRAEFVVGAQTPGGEPVTDFSGEAEVQLPDGSRRTVQLIRQDDLLTGSFRDTQTPGDYTLTVTARRKSDTLGTTQSRFLVYQQDLELDNAAADVPLMESLAVSTGGQRLAPEQLPELIRRLNKTDESLIIRIETKRTFWDTWTFFALFVSTLGAEWFLRKRWGLV